MLEYNGQLYASTYNYYTDEFGNQQSNGGQIWRSPTGDFEDWYSVVLNGSGSIFSGDPSNNEFFRLFTLQNPDRICATTWTDGSSHGAEIWCSRTGDFSSWTSLLGSNDWLRGWQQLRLHGHRGTRRCNLSGYLSIPPAAVRSGAPSITVAPGRRSTTMALATVTISSSRPWQSSMGICMPPHTTPRCRHRSLALPGLRQQRLGAGRR